MESESYHIRLATIAACGEQSQDIFSISWFLIIGIETNAAA